MPPKSWDILCQMMQNQNLDIERRGCWNLKAPDPYANRKYDNLMPGSTRLSGGIAHRNKAMPIAPPTIATASAPKPRLLRLSAPFCSFGVAVLVAAADVAVCCSTTAKLVIVVICPLDSCVVSRTKLWTTPPPGV
jgi:hypothetical protein